MLFFVSVLLGFGSGLERNEGSRSGMHICLALEVVNVYIGIIPNYFFKKSNINGVRYVTSG